MRGCFSKNGVLNIVALLKRALQSIQLRRPSPTLSPKGGEGEKYKIRAIVFAVAFIASPASAAPIKILALGTSLTQGYGLPPGTEYPVVLEDKLKAAKIDAKVINAGVSGDTSAGGASRIDWSLADHPDVAIVELGSNDALRGLRPAQTEKNISTVLEKLKAAHVPVLLLGMKAPRNLGPEYAAEFDPIYPRLAKKYGADLYPFVLDGVALNPKLNQSDGMHPNPQGVQIIVSHSDAVCEKAAGAKGALMFRRLASVGGFTLLSRITGFVRDVLMAAILGAGPLSDAFLVAFRLPNNFRAIFAEGAFNLAFLPRYAAMREREGHEAAGQFANRVYSWQMITQVVLLLAALGAMRPIISIMAPGFAAHPGQLELATSLARIAFPYLIFTVVAVQLSAMLNAVGKFAAAAAWSIFLNIAMIAALCFAPFFPNAAYAAAWGVFAAGILQLVFIIWAGARSHLRLKFERPRWTPEIKQFLIALGAATFGSASVQIGLFIDNVIASFLPSGDLTALYYADRINQLPMGTLGIAIGTVLLPEMSSLLAKNDRKGADEAQNRSAALALFLTLPFVAAFMTVPLTIMQGLFAHGAFHLQAAQISADGADGLWHRLARFRSDPLRLPRLLCAGRYGDTGARHRRRCRGEHRIEGGACLGLAFGRHRHCVGHLDRCVGECGCACDAGALARVAYDRHCFLAQPSADSPCNHRHGRGRIAWRVVGSETAFRKRGVDR